VLLLKCLHKANVRCVIVRDCIVVPADFAMTVPVKMSVLNPKMSVTGFQRLRNFTQDYWWPVPCCHIVLIFLLLQC